MALQTSGAISLNDIHVEAGGTTGSQATINDSDIRGLISKASGAQMSFSEWYGAASEVTLTSAGTVNGEDQRQEITVSNFINSGGTLIIPSNIWVWSDSTATPALTIDVSCTIKNSGKVIGKGGGGGTGVDVGDAAGPAIKINTGVTGVTIINNSGAYIAGGGGGGAGSSGGGGGGAGGGRGGNDVQGANHGTGGAGGALNAAGARGTGGSNNSYGGGAGGGGSSSGGSGGGGRILPGTGGASADNGGPPYDGAGGSAGNAGQTGSWCGGGGGWGANGGSAYNYGSRAGGSGGKAIDDSGVSYTLTNNGTIYGGT
jgi:hypothetical protein